MEAVLLISYKAATQFSLMIFFIPNGLFALSNTCVTRGSSFVDDLRVRRCCLRCRIHASPVEAVSLMISDSAATEFSLKIS